MSAGVHALAGNATPNPDPSADGLFDVSDVVTVRGAIGQWDPVEHPEYDADRTGLLDDRDLLLLSRIVTEGAALPPFLGLSENLTGSVFVTREATLSYEITVQGAAGDFMVLEGDTVLFSGTNSGTGTASLTLAEGLNLFTLTLEDSAGNSVLREVEVRRDSSPPMVVIDSPNEDALITTLAVPVRGQALDGDTPAAVEVNGVLMNTNADGTFQGTVPFTLDAGGTRSLVATARDAAGNSATDRTEIELFVSPPQTLEMQAARIDLPAGALCRRGETATLAAATNSEVRALLGPGAEGVVASSGSGLTDGVIILPSAMMIAVEGQEDETAGVIGAAPEPLFANRPAISLENEAGATNAMPLWIFQIVPDGDGDGHPELSLAARAKVAEDGPHAGRIVPIEPIADDSFPGTFNTDLPVFNNETLKQVAAIPAAKALLDRIEAQKQAGGDPKTRVTFYCCAASAVVPVKGRAKCGSLSATQVIERLIAAQNDLQEISRDMTASANRVAEAEDTRINAVSDIAGLTDVPTPGGGKVAVPTLLNGKLYGCLKNFVPASKALDRIEGVAGTLGDVGLIQTALGQSSPPLQETASALTAKALEHAETRLRARAETVALDEFRDIVGKVDKLKEYQGKLKELDNVYNCAALGFRVGQLITSVTTIFTEPAVADALQDAYDIRLRVFKRLADCYRHNVGLADGSLDGKSVFPEYLQFQQSTGDILTRLNTLKDFSESAIDNDQRFAQLLFDMAVLLEPGHPQSVDEQLDFAERFVAILEEERALINRQDEVFNGFDAIAESAMMTPVLVERIKAASDLIDDTNEREIAAQGGLPGTYITLQGSGSPLATVSGPDGGFVHFIDTRLTIDNGPPRNAILEGRVYAVDAEAGDGLQTGQANGSVEDQVFPFTPFSTVDFDVLVDIGDVTLASSLTDENGIDPMVEILSPTADTIGFAGRPIRVDVTSSDDVAVLGVELTVDGQSEEGLPGGMASGIVTLAPTTGTQTITATAVDPGGNLGTDSVAISVVDADQAFVLSPAKATLGLGETLQFSATLLGNDVTDRVAWLINGIEGGNPAVTGSITPGGLFDTAPLDVGAPAAYRVRVQAELPQYPGFRPEATLTVLDSRFVVSNPVGFTFPAPSAPGGLLASRPIGFSFPAPSAPGGLLVSKPLAFSFPSPGAPSGLLVSRPLAFTFPSPQAPGGLTVSKPLAFERQ